MKISNTDLTLYRTTANVDKIQPNQQLGMEGKEKEALAPLPKQDMQINQQQKTQDITEESVIKKIEEANKALQFAHTNLRFAIHEKTKQIMVKVINAETKEVIREIPPEKVLDMVAKVWEKAGILIDKRH